MAALKGLHEAKANSTPSPSLVCKEGIHNFTQENKSICQLR